MPEGTSLTIAAGTPHTGWNPGPRLVEVDRRNPDADRVLRHDLTSAYQKVIADALAGT